MKLDPASSDLLQRKPNNQQNPTDDGIYGVKLIAIFSPELLSQDRQHQYLFQDCITKFVYSAADEVKAM